MRKIMNAILTLSILVTLTMPQKGHALMTGSLPAAIGVSVFTGLAMEIQDSRNGTRAGGASDRPAKDKFSFMRFLGNTLINYTFIGLLILEDDSGLMTFREADSKMVSCLGLSAEEVEIYNEEVPQVNAIVEEIAVALNQLENPTNKDSSKLWKSYLDYLSPETIKVMKLTMSQNDYKCKKASVVDTNRLNRAKVTTQDSTIDGRETSATISR